MTESKIYVFMGEDALFPSGIFSEKEIANQWVQKNSLSGVLTAYPLNIGVYDWAIEKKYFTPKKDYQSNAVFIGKFSTASMEHYHFKNGKIG